MRVPLVAADSSLWSADRTMRLLLTCALLVGVVSSLPWDSPEEDERASATTCACGWTNKGRIVGGKEVQKNAYPLIVAIQFKTNGSMFCGGTIITPWHVLTAAHCVYKEKASDLFVNAGAHYRTGQSDAIYPVAKYVNHENYINERLINDISLLVTARQMNFNQNVGPACLPTSRLNLEGQSVKAIGWGRTSEDKPSSVLKEVDLRVISFEQCSSALRMFEDITPQRETNMCTLGAGIGVHKGDSGGPLLWLDPATNRYTLVALVSYGSLPNGDQVVPFTDVGAFLPWINHNIAATKPGAKTCTKA